MKIEANKEVISLWLPFYEDHFGALSILVKTKLLSISFSTIGRLLSARRKAQTGKSGTKTVKKFKNLISIKKLYEVIRSF